MHTMRTTGGRPGLLRAALAAVLAGAFMTLPAASVAAESESMRTVVELRAAGRLRPAGAEEQPVRLEAEFDLLQAEAAASEALPHAAIRHYTHAAAKTSLAGGVTTVRLPAEASTLAVALEGMMPVPFPPRGLLTREEFDLLEIPFDPLLMAKLLAEAPTEAGEAREVSPDLVAGLLAIDTVVDGGLRVRLLNADRDERHFEIGGRVEGAADGVSTTVEVTGSFAAAVRKALIRRAAVAIHEVREASHVAAGFDLEASLRVTQSPAELSDDEPAAAAITAARRRLAGDLRDEDLPATRWRGGEASPGMLWYADSEDRFSCRYESAWRIVENGPQGVVMRLVDLGALVAQASITPLPGDGEAWTEARLRRDIERSLAGQVEEVVSCEAFRRDDGLEVVRAVSRGTAEGLEFRWVHTVICRPGGGGVSLTTMVEEPLVGRFGDADRRLAAGVAISAPSQEGSAS
jgi:hypothetical protein